MRLSRAWLADWLSTELSAEALGEQLTRLGLEVDAVLPVAPGLAHVVVGRVLETRPHPNADRLRICAVDAGETEPRAVVCGAANARAGGCYPLALPGARLPGGLVIEPSRIRGEDSAGMLCSAVELGLADSADGLFELPSDSVPGQPISQALSLDDSVIDIDLTPNRADCFSVLGVARDLAASLGTEFVEPRVLPVLPVSDEEFPVRVDAPADCPRFVGRVIRDLDPDAETPLWMRERLRRAGVRSLHPVVDITNYVLLEFGQPMHAYDLQKLAGGIEVRRAGRGERLELLDGQTANLEPDMLLITDRRGPIGLAGIMGGASTAVGTATQHIFLESAFFDPEVIAGRARRLGLHTDASMRFERGVDPAHQQRAVERATALVLEITGGCPGPVVELAFPEHLPKRAAVTLRRERLAAVLGVKIADQQVSDLLRRLAMQVEAHADGWRVTPPAARFDIALEVDLIEEIARLHGYDQIPEIPAVTPLSLGRVGEDTVGLDRARLTLVERGYQEAITYSFGDPALDAAFAGGNEGLRLSNPISANLGVMRQSLWPGLAQALKYNLSRQHSRVRLFETGLRFIFQGNDLKEEKVIAGIATGGRYPQQWDLTTEAIDVFDIKSDLEALAGLTGAAGELSFHATEHPALRPGRAAECRRAHQVVGYFGELHPSLVRRLDLGEPPVLFELNAALLLAASRPTYRRVSRFPATRRDLAMVVPEEIPAAELLAAVRRSAGPMLVDVVLFDVYTGGKVETGSKSVALGLILQDTSRTLTDADVDGVLRDVTACLSREFNATIRE